MVSSMGNLRIGLERIVQTARTSHPRTALQTIGKGLTLKPTQIRNYTRDDYDAVALWGIPRRDRVGTIRHTGGTREEARARPRSLHRRGGWGAVVGTVIGGYDGRRGLIYHLAVDPNPAIADSVGS